MGIGNKLDILITSTGRNVNDVARAANVPASTVYSIIKRDNTKADLDDLQRLAKELGVTLEYFVDGYKSEPAPALRPDEFALLALYNQLNRAGQEKACDLLDDIVSSGKYKIYEGMDPSEVKDPIVLKYEPSLQKVVEDQLKRREEYLDAHKSVPTKETV